MVPEGWMHTTFGKHIDCLTGFAFKSDGYSFAENDIRLLRGDNIVPGGLRWRDAKLWPKNELDDLDRYQLQEGDFVIALDRTWISNGLKVAEVTSKDLPCLLVQRVARVRAKHSLEQSLLRQYFSGNRFEQYVKSVQTATAVPHISPNDIKEFTLLLPTVPEQKKIAQILSTWDQAISANERLLENSQQRKKGLMQQLLTGKKRLSGFECEWTKVPLGSIFSRVTTRNEGQSTNVVTISGQQGLIRQQEFFKKSVASETLDGYYLLKNGQFAYNKSYSHGYPMGAIKRLNRYSDGVVTTLYICFELADSNAADGDFYEQYFESGLMIKGLMQIAHEGGRAHGLLNVKPSDFFSLKLHLPSIREQKAISLVLCKADEEVEAQKRLLNHLQQEKKALMQQLLTGKRRVQVETEAA